MAGKTVGLQIEARSGPGVLHELTGIIARHEGDITLVEILERSAETTRLYLELEMPGPANALLGDLREAKSIRSVDAVETFQRVYGKRMIIMGGGAQGEHISVDTIPLVGEQPLAEAVRAVTRLPRARALVLAGALMGGEIEAAVREVRAQGLLVVSLNMAGSVPDAADFVVTDPVQAGVMAVMAVAETARFRPDRLKRRVF
jgi:energy-converting hydrogenase B subunit Q